MQQRYAMKICNKHMQRNNEVTPANFQQQALVSNNSREFCQQAYVMSNPPLPSFIISLFPSTIPTMYSSTIPTMYSFYPLYPVLSIFDS